MAVKYPHIVVNLSDTSGDAFIQLQRVVRQMQRADLTMEEIKAYRTMATAKDWDHFMKVTRDTVRVT